MIVEYKRGWRTLGFRFDALAGWLLCQQFGVDLDTMQKIPETEYVPAWVWNAHKSYCMFRYKKPKLTYKQTKRFIGTMPKDRWDNEFLPVMLSTRGPEGEGDKKKVPTSQTFSGQDGNAD